MNTTLFENIDWVGHVDRTVRDFHGYSTDRGATYNAYLVRDSKTALIDTVKAPFADQLLSLEGEEVRVEFSRPRERQGRRYRSEDGIGEYAADDRC